jgi:hypothetical protein
VKYELVPAWGGSYGAGYSVRHISGYRLDFYYKHTASVFMESLLKVPHPDGYEEKYWRKETLKETIKYYRRKTNEINK